MTLLFIIIRNKIGVKIITNNFQFYITLLFDDNTGSMEKTFEPRFF